MDELTVEIKKGTVLFKEGDTSQDLYIVQRGVVEILKTGDGKQLPLAVVNAGQLIGALSFLDAQPRSASAEAATDITVLKLDKPKLEKELTKLPSWLMVLIKSIAQRVREADDLVKRNSIVDKTVEAEFERWKTT